MSETAKTIAEITSGHILVTVSEFNRVKYVDIRKYYRDDAGETRPTKKGISLNREQFGEVLKALNTHKDLIESELA